MRAGLDPFRFLLIALAGWMNQHQQHAIAYLVEENRVLREQIGRRRLKFTDEQRRRLAAKARIVGTKWLSQIATIVTPDTLLAWHRKLIAQKYDGTGNRQPGRPRILAEVQALIVRMARENREWGYRRIQGALANLGYDYARSTVANILKTNGIDPAPDRSRRTAWKEFLRRHWSQIVATDFFTIEVWTRKGLQRFVVLFFLELSTKRVAVAGVAATPDGLWMTQIARNLTDGVDGFFMGKRYLIHDRDPLYTHEFLNVLANVGVQSVKLPRRSPNLNAYAERFVRTIKESCLDRMIWFGEDALRRGISEFVSHYHFERNHQGLDNRLISPKQTTTATTGRVRKRERLGGMLNYYFREAA